MCSLTAHSLSPNTQPSSMHSFTVHSLFPKHLTIIHLLSNSSHSITRHLAIIHVLFYYSLYIPRHTTITHGCSYRSLLIPSFLEQSHKQSHHLNLQGLIRPANKWTIRDPTQTTLQIYPNRTLTTYYRLKLIVIQFSGRRLNNSSWRIFHLL